MIRSIVSPEQSASYRFLLRWMGVASIAGVVGASMLELFRRLVALIQGLLLSLDAPVPVYALGGALLVGGVIYRICADAAGEGIPSYLHALQHGHARFPFLVTITKFPAAILTLGTFGSGGAIGPVGRVVAGLVSLGAGRHHDPKVREDRSRTAAICGLAATVAALFHSPIGGGIFAVEIIQRTNMRYRDLFPAILAGAVSVWFARVAGWVPLIRVADGVGGLEIGTLPWTVGFAIVIAGLSGAYVRGYAMTVRLFRRNQGRTVGKVVLGMTAASLLVWLVNPEFLGMATAVTSSLANGDLARLYGVFGPATPLSTVALTMLALRMVSVYLTTGSGMNAGLTAPAIQIGMLAAVAASELIAPWTGEGVLDAFLVVGFSGMLAGAMNVPIAAAVIGIEVFGRNLGIPAAIAAVVAFQINRHRTIYDVAVAGSGHLEDLYEKYSRDDDQ